MATPQYIKDAQNNYNAKFDLIQIRLPKGTKERIKKITDSSMANFCLDAVMETIESYEAAERYENEEDQEEIETDTPDEPMHPAPVKYADPVENVKPLNGPKLDREKLEALQAEIEKRKEEAEAKKEAKTAEQEAKEKDQRERAETYNKEMQEHVKRYGVTGKWLSEGGY